MAKKEKQTDGTEIEYNFPAEGVTVMASSGEEALEKLKKLQNENKS